MYVGEGCAHLIQFKESGKDSGRRSERKEDVGTVDGRRKVQAEEREGTESLARSLKLVQPGRAGEWFSREDPEMRLIVLCVFIVFQEQHKFFQGRGHVIVIIWLFLYSLIFNVCTS